VRQRKIRGVSKHQRGRCMGRHTRESEEGFCKSCHKYCFLSCFRTHTRHARICFAQKSSDFASRRAPAGRPPRRNGLLDGNRNDAHLHGCSILAAGVSEVWTLTLAQSAGGTSRVLHLHWTSSSPARRFRCTAPVINQWSRSQNFGDFTSQL